MNVKDSAYNWDEIYEVDKPTFSLFDMTQSDIDNLYIKKFHSGNCFVIDNRGSYYNGFILSKNSRNRTECRIDFFPPKTTGKHTPRPLFQIVKIDDGSIKESNQGNDRTRRIPFQEDKDGRENFWKLIQFLLRFKDIVDYGEFEEKFEIVSKDSVIQRLKNKPTTEDKKAEIAEYSEKLQIPASEMASYLEMNDRIITLQEFDNLLNQNNYIATYRQKYQIVKDGDEAVWHHFLKKHPWVFWVKSKLEVH